MQKPTWISEASKVAVGTEKVDFWSRWEAKNINLSLSFLVFRENHVFCSEKRFFRILGAKSAILELILAPPWPQNVQNHLFSSLWVLL